METMHKYRILKKDNNTSSVVALEKIPTPTPKYATVEQLNEVKQDVNEVKQEVKEINAKLDLILQKK
jgi:hypothetical protein